jgi:hypothetical protein
VPEQKRRILLRAFAPSLGDRWPRVVPDTSDVAVSEIAAQNPLERVLVLSVSSISIATISSP